MLMLIIMLFFLNLVYLGYVYMNLFGDGLKAQPVHLCTIDYWDPLICEDCSLGIFKTSTAH